MTRPRKVFGRLIVTVRNRRYRFEMTKTGLTIHPVRCGARKTRTLTFTDALDAAHGQQLLLATKP